MLRPTDERHWKGIHSMLCVQGFSTTQGTFVEDDAVNSGAVKTKTTRHARQYMNRKGGFNRALPAEVTGVRTNAT